MGAKASIQIDSNKLKEEFRKRGLTNYAEINRKMGYGANAIQWAFKNNAMTPLMLNCIKVTYGIALEDIEPDKEPEKEPENVAEEVKQETHQVDVTQIYHAVKSAFADAMREAEEEKLQKAKGTKNDAEFVLIYRAVLDAVNQAFKINAKDLRGLIYTAMTSAIRVNVKKEYLNND